jgi:hypothetical protein
LEEKEGEDPVVTEEEDPAGEEEARGVERVEFPEEEEEAEL